MVATSVYMLVVRLIHILAAIFWVGSVALFTLFLTPAAAEVGPAAGPLIANLVAKRRAVRAIAGSGIVTVVAGAFAYWHDAQVSGGVGNFVDTAYGRVLTIGAIAALVGLAIGLSIVLPGVEGAVRLGGRIAAAGADATPDMREHLGAMQRRNKRASRTVLAFLVLAAAAMATAQSW
jgi:uncharacterized membrane protein